MLLFQFQKSIKCYITAPGNQSTMIDGVTVNKELKMK